jgi:hypothetical protein
MIVPGNPSIRLSCAEMGNDCSAKTFESPIMLFTFRPSAAIVAAVLVLFQKLTAGLRTRLVLI